MTMSENPKGLLLTIYRSARGGDCTNNGVSAHADTALVIGVNVPEIFDAGDCPVLRLTQGLVTGTARLIPLGRPAGAAGPMFGGNYGASSDSRFTAAVEAICGHEFYGAVPIHDRFEWPLA